MASKGIRKPAGGFWPFSGITPAALAVMAALCGPAAAQQPAYPYQYTPKAPAQHNVAPTGSTPLTVPLGAIYAVACASTATVRYTTDGTVPTAMVGMPLAAGSCVGLQGTRVLAGFLAISASGTLDVEYFQ